MTSQASCYHSGCTTAVKWGISSSVEQKNPDGTSLTLFACDKHEGALTVRLRKAGTRYSLFPTNGPHFAPPIGLPPETVEEAFKQDLARRPAVVRFLINATTILVVVVIAPFLLLYYGGQWALDHRRWSK